MVANCFHKHRLSNTVRQTLSQALKIAHLVGLLNPGTLGLVDPNETIEEWEEARRIRMDRVAVDIASALRRWGFERGGDYGSIIPSSEVSALYVAGVTAESVAYAIAMMLAVAMPEDLRNVGLDVPDENYEAQEFTVIACGSRADLNDFCNRPMGGSSDGP